MNRKDELDAALWTVIGNDPDPPSVKLGRYWEQMPEWTRLVLAGQMLHDAATYIEDITGELEQPAQRLSIAVLPALDGLGNVHIADTLNNRIVTVTPAGVGNVLSIGRIAIA